MALDMGYAHFHHLAFDVVDIGKMRDLLDHLVAATGAGCRGRTRHGIAGNIATYVRIIEEPCHVELYCDMERLADDHAPRIYPDDRYSSNTWGLPCRGRTSASTRSRSSGRARAGDAGCRCRRPSALTWLHGSARRGPDRRSSPTRPGTTSARSSSSTTGPTRRRPSRSCRRGSSRTPTRAGAPSSRPTGSRARRAATSSSTLPLAVQGGLRRLQRPARRRGGHGLPYIWVDRDFALTRGWIQGFPKKLGSIWVTRSFGLGGPADPGMEPGARFGVTCAAYERASRRRR